MPRRLHAALLFASSLAVAIATSSRPLRAQELRYSAPVDLSVALAGAGAWAVSETERDGLVPEHCRWCDRATGDIDTLNAFDRWGRKLRWRRRELARELSNVTAYLATPALAGGLTAVGAGDEQRGRDIGANTVVIGEAAVIAADLNQLVKFLVARERPDAHALALVQPGLPTPRRVDDDLSFYSGHTSVAVATAVAGGTVASLRGYRLAPLVWATALPPALFTGYLRVAADRHYLSDVLVGAATGAIVGFVIPYVFHRPDPSLTPSVGNMPLALSASRGYSLGFSGAF